MSRPMRGYKNKNKKKTEKKQEGLKREASELFRRDETGHSESDGNSKATEKPQTNANSCLNPCIAQRGLHHSCQRHASAEGHLIARILLNVVRREAARHRRRQRRQPTAPHSVVSLTRGSLNGIKLTRRFLWNHAINCHAAVCGESTLPSRHPGAYGTSWGTCGGGGGGGRL
jgi:hypothetical protein